MIDTVIVRDIVHEDMKLFNKGLSLMCDDFMDDGRIIKAGTIDLIDGSAGINGDARQPTTIAVSYPKDVAALTQDRKPSREVLEMCLEYDEGNTEGEAFADGLQFYNFVVGRHNRVNSEVARQLTGHNIDPSLWGQVQKVAVEMTMDTPQMLSGLSKDGGEGGLSLALKPLEVLWFLPERPEKTFRPLGRNALKKHISSNNATLHVSRARLYVPEPEQLSRNRFRTAARV